MEPDDTEYLLSQRGKTHGPYKVHAEITQQLKRVMESYDNWLSLSDSQRETLAMIAHKIGRILAGDPDVQDHWDDIAGYAKLVSKELAGPVIGFVPRRTAEAVVTYNTELGKVYGEISPVIF